MDHQEPTAPDKGRNIGRQSPESTPALHCLDVSGDQQAQGVWVCGFVQAMRTTEGSGPAKLFSGRIICQRVFLELTEGDRRRQTNQEIPALFSRDSLKSESSEESFEFIA